MEETEELKRLIKTKRLPLAEIEPYPLAQINQSITVGSNRPLSNRNPRNQDIEVENDETHFVGRNQTQSENMNSTNQMQRISASPAGGNYTYSIRNGAGNQINNGATANNILPYVEQDNVYKQRGNSQRNIASSQTRNRRRQ